MDTKAEYEARVRRVMTAAANKEPDRVPIMPGMMPFATDYYGHTMAKVTYDARVGVEVALKYLEEFKPDQAMGFYSNAGKGPILELLQPKSCAWPGAPDKRIPDDSYHQFIEFPVLEEDEMEFFERDYTGWLFQKGLPKVVGLLDPFADWNTSILGVNSDVSMLASQLARPEMRNAIETLWKVDGMNKEIQKIHADGQAKMLEMGFPSFSIAMGSSVPFDNYSDFFRGTLESMADMYDHRDLIERFIDERIERSLANIRAAAKANEHLKDSKWGHIILHKGMDGFMNKEQYENLYWKHLKMLIHEINAAGFKCYVYTEGPYTSRIDHLTEVDPNMVVYHFENVDLVQAKKKLGNIACIAGGFPVWIVEHGTKQQVIDEVKRVLDICAPGGGYIFEGGYSFGKAPIENVRAMFETVLEYGRY
jgi:uroporphyrinogen-III decarboxylase